jgi:hypothetical protein
MGVLPLPFLAAALAPDASSSSTYTTSTHAKLKVRRDSSYTLNATLALCAVTAMRVMLLHSADLSWCAHQELPQSAAQHTEAQLSV